MKTRTESLIMNEDNMKLLFNWHNGLVIEKELSYFLNENFKFIKNESYDYLTFEGENGEHVKINKDGEILESPYNIPLCIEKRAKKRMDRTNKMFKSFEFTSLA